MEAKEHAEELLPVLQPQCLRASQSSLTPFPFRFTNTLIASVISSSAYLPQVSLAMA